MDLLNFKPKEKFTQKHMLKLLDYSTDEILTILSLAIKLKAEKKAGIPHPHLKGKTLAMIFLKNSTRTRVSFETGIYQLGGMGLFLSAKDIQLLRGENIADTARTLSRMVDGIMIRTFQQSDVENFAKYGSVPVINGLTDDFHPCQALADLMTFYEYKDTFTGTKLTFIGDGNNMAHSLMVICAKLGMDFAIACPKGYEPNPDVVNAAKESAKQTGSSILITKDPKEAAKDADAVYTDVWASMGQESGAEQKYKDFKGYFVDASLMSLAKKDAIFMHCLPAHRGEEVTEDVIDGPQSVIFDEAENRLHAQKALMVLLMKGD